MDLDLTGRRPVEHPGVGPLRFFDHRIALTERADGTGLVATADIPRGTVVWMSDPEGEVTSWLTREQLEAPDGPLAAAGIKLEDYFAHCWVVDSRYYQGPKIPKPGGSFEEAKRADASNFLDHSCSPTIWFDGDHNMTARVDISAGDAITYDSCTSEIDLGIFPASECRCGSDECRGTLTSFDYRRTPLRHRYAGHFLSTVTQTLEKELALPATLGQGPYYSLHRDVELRAHSIPLIGRGLFATRFIPAGTAIWKDVPDHEAASIGKTHRIEEVLRWRNSEDPEEREQFVWAQKYGYQISKTSYDVPSRADIERDYSYFMNHSCDPSCWILTACVWVARRDIQPGEEIHYDYATTEGVLDRIIECACGAPDCRGAVTAQDWKEPEFQRRYEGHIADYLLNPD
jgi:hypothetical protein